MSTESDRIRFLIERDGPEAARQWVMRTLAMYRQALDSPTSHASKPEYRHLFKAAVYEFEQWLASGALPDPHRRLQH